MPEWKAGSDCSDRKTGMVDIREREPNGRWGFIGCVAASVAEHIVTLHNAALATPLDAVQAAERLLKIHTYTTLTRATDGHPICDEEEHPWPCEAVITARAALSGHQAGGGDQLRRIYRWAAEIQRMTAFSAIGFRCSLIREAVSLCLPDDEAKRLHDETEAALAAPAEGASPAASRLDGVRSEGSPTEPASH